MTLETFHDIPPVPLVSETSREQEIERLIQQRHDIQKRLGYWSVLVNAANEGYNATIVEVLENNQAMAESGVHSSDYVGQFQRPDDVSRQLFGEMDHPAELIDTYDQILIK
jgi:hypothetical protein